MSSEFRLKARNQEVTTRLMSSLITSV